MAGELRNFDPDKYRAEFSPSVAATAAGAASLDLTRGLIGGPNSIQETKDAAKYTRAVDRQGNVVRNKIRNKSGMLSFVYKHESEIHDVLSLLASLDEQTDAITGSIIVKDLNGRTIMTYVGAFIENDPDDGAGDTGSDRTWVWGYAQRIPFQGGSAAL